MDPKARIKSIKEQANVGDARDKEIDTLTRLLICTAKIERIEASINYLEQEMKILEMERKNLNMTLEELGYENPHQH